MTPSFKSQVRNPNLPPSPQETLFKSQSDQIAVFFTKFGNLTKLSPPPGQLFTFNQSVTLTKNKSSANL